MWSRWAWHPLQLWLHNPFRQLWYIWRHFIAEEDEEEDEDEEEVVWETEGIILDKKDDDEFRLEGEWFDPLVRLLWGEREGEGE